MRTTTKQEIPQENKDVKDLSNYTLTRDRQRRKIRRPSRYAYNNYVSYALKSFDDYDCDEPERMKFS